MCGSTFCALKGVAVDLNPCENAGVAYAVCRVPCVGALRNYRVLSYTVTAFDYAVEWIYEPIRMHSSRSIFMS